MAHQVLKLLQQKPWCHKNSWIYLRSTYYWWLLRPMITIRFDSKFPLIAQSTIRLIDWLNWFEMKKTLFAQHYWLVANSMHTADVTQVHSKSCQHLRCVLGTMLHIIHWYTSLRISKRFVCVVLLAVWFSLSCYRSTETRQEIKQALQCLACELSIWMLMSPIRRIRIIYKMKFH